MITTSNCQIKHLYVVIDNTFWLLYNVVIKIIGGINMANSVNSENTKPKKRVLPKILFVIIAILLMMGIAFVVANIVHSRNTVFASSNVKDGLSAYELAVEQGFDGSLEEWLKSLESKSAYEIAAENGYKGTEREWNKALADISNQNTASINSAEFSSKGELLITLSDGTTINVGAVAGTDGKDGINGKNGADGKNGTNGKNGVNGKDGIDGKGISSAFVNEKDQLILQLSDGSSINLDKIVGAKGAKGENGTDGKDGIGIHEIEIADNGALTVTLTNGTVLNLGNIKGTDGVGIFKSEINSDGELILTYTNGETVNLGKVTNNNSENGTDSTGIKNVTMTSNGELIITLTDNSVINLGNVKGEKGDKGDKGDKGTDGKDGRGIAKTELVNGELVIFYTDGTSDNLGAIGASVNDSVSMLNFTMLDDGTLSVSIKDECKTIAEDIVIPSTFNGRTVSAIANSGFEYCKNLKSIKLPEGLTAIPSGAFIGCDSLETIYIPKNVVSISNSAFSTGLSSNVADIPLRYAYFEEPSGWERVPKSWFGEPLIKQKENVDSEMLSNPEKAAELLKEYTAHVDGDRKMAVTYEWTRNN